MRRAVLLAPLLLAACNDPGLTGVPEVRVATAAEVSGCTYVSNLRATPGISGPLEGRALEFARNRVKAQARESGANTIVWDPDSAGDLVYIVDATAYRC